jgi:L-arabinose isomerase
MDKGNLTAVSSAMSAKVNTVQVPRRKPLFARVGVFGVGHATYWPQFPGLLDVMHNKLETLCRKLSACGVEVVNFGLVDNAQGAYALLPRLQAADLDLVFCDMVTYATSSTFGVIIRNLNIPLVMVALQPLPALDYPRATTYMQLCNDDFCAVPEFAGVAVRMGKRVPPLILGMLENDPIADADLAQWCQIAKVLHALRTARIGLMGHVLEAMLDMHSDPTAITAAFGCHIVQVEPDDLMRHHRDIPESLIAEKMAEILNLFDTPDPQSDPITRRVTEEDLRVAAKAAVALDRLIAEKSLDGLAYYYEGEPGSPMRELMANLIVGNSLLTAAGFPMCGEADLKTCVAMMILDRLEAGGSFAEFHPIDFREGFVLVGHDGPHHINIAEGKPVLRSLDRYHGKPGAGASVEFKIREGPITLLGITQTETGRCKFVVAEGQSVKGPIPATGNTNTRGYFLPDVRTFLRRWVAEGPTHHFALAVGHLADTLRHIAETLTLPCAIVARGND